MKINLFANWSVSLFLILTLMPNLPLQAQEKDWGVWTKIGGEHNIMPNLVVSSNLEWRTKNALKKTDRWGLDICGKYAISSWLKIGAGYEVHYRNRGEIGWKFRHRYHADGTIYLRFLKYRISLRERFQHTFAHGEQELFLRSRVKWEYCVSKCLQPYVSVEMYNGLNSDDHFSMRRVRYRGGITFSLSSSWKMELFYCRQWEADNRKNVLGMAYVYSY